MQRPTGITILAILDFIGAAIELLIAILFFAGGSFLSSITNAPGASMFGNMMGAAGLPGGVVFLLFAAIGFAIGFGFWKLQNWARIIQIVFLIIGLAFGLLGVVRVFSAFSAGILVYQLVVLGLEAFILWYVLTPAVKAAFAGQAPASA